MHEYGVTQELLQLVLRETETAGAWRVLRVNLLLGTFSSVVEDSVRFFWGGLAAGTPAEGAALEFAAVAPLARCRGCQAQYQPNERDQRCPACGEAIAELLAGDEFRVESLDVE